MISALDHVQVAIPQGAEGRAREFYGELLEMEEIAKPSALALRGGCWFRAGTAVLHLGVEEPFVPARKAHPAFLVTDLHQLQQRLEQARYTCARSDNELPGVHRFHTNDPFGNRIEFQQG